jgi:hypothetical protein
LTHYYLPQRCTLRLGDNLSANLFTIIEDVLGPPPLSLEIMSLVEIMKELCPRGNNEVLLFISGFMI